MQRLKKKNVSMGGGSYSQKKEKTMPFRVYLKEKPRTMNTSKWTFGLHNRVENELVSETLRRELEFPHPRVVNIENKHIRPIVKLEFIWRTSIYVHTHMYIHHFLVWIHLCNIWDVILKKKKII